MVHPGCETQVRTDTRSRLWAAVVVAMRTRFPALDSTMCYWSEDLQFNSQEAGAELSGC